MVLWSLDDNYVVSACHNLKTGENVFIKIWETQTGKLLYFNLLIFNNNFFF